MPVTSDPQDEFWCRVAVNDDGRMVCRGCGRPAEQFPHDASCAYAGWFDRQMRRKPTEERR